MVDGSQVVGGESNGWQSVGQSAAGAVTSMFEKVPGDLCLLDGLLFGCGKYGSTVRRLSRVGRSVGRSVGLSVRRLVSRSVDRSRSVGRSKAAAVTTVIDDSLGGEIG